jgi:hypothetical protein
MPFLPVNSVPLGSKFYGTLYDKIMTTYAREYFVYQVVVEIVSTISTMEIKV